MTINLLGFKLTVGLEKIREKRAEDIFWDIQTAMENDRNTYSCITTMKTVLKVMDLLQKEYEECTETTETQEWYEYSIESLQFGKVLFSVNAA